MELADKILPDRTVIECFIDPFTGQFITNEMSKSSEHHNKKNLSVCVTLTPDCEEEAGKDEGVGSLPCTVPTTPTHSNTVCPTLSLPADCEDREAELASLDDGICTSGSEGRVRDSALSLVSQGEESGVCQGSVARGITRFQGEAAEI